MPIPMHSEEELVDRGLKYDHDAECDRCKQMAEMWVDANGIQRPFTRKTGLIPHVVECRRNRAETEKQNG
jgi:hypothetical protein